MTTSARASLISWDNIINIQLVFVPVAITLEFVHASPVLIFLVCCLAIIPLAGWMGKSTEALAATLGAGLGGLLNATFGNAAELIIALIALSNGYTDVVKASITGSIIGNVLLVLGFSIFAGGLKYPKQKFNATAASVGTTLLVVSAIALLIPAAFHFVSSTHARERELSVEISVILFLAYIGSLIFSLKTHPELYAGGAEDHHPPTMTRKKSILILVLSTLGVALMSEFLVATVEPTAKQFGLTEVFIGVILVAIIGNAAEHSSAIMFALKNKMELSLNIAVGSSVQVALLIAPVLVFAGLLLGQPMDLVFTTFEVLAVAASVAIVALVAMDGESNWMEGLMLLCVYAILALAFYHLPV
jgi:Ca2+:H+ antiporter